MLPYHLLREPGNSIDLGQIVAELQGNFFRTFFGGNLGEGENVLFHLRDVIWEVPKMVGETPTNNHGFVFLLK